MKPQNTEKIEIIITADGTQAEKEIDNITNRLKELQILAATTKDNIPNNRNWINRILHRPAKPTIKEIQALIIETHNNAYMEGYNHGFQDGEYYTLEINKTRKPPHPNQTIQNRDPDVA